MSSLFIQSNNLCCKQIITISNHITRYQTPCCMQKQLGLVGLSYQLFIAFNDVWRVDGPPCDKHLQNPRHRFHEHAKFTIIEKINNASLPKHQRQNLLEYSKHFWILRDSLSLSTKGLNKSLNHLQDTADSIWPQLPFTCSRLTIEHQNKV